MGYHISTIITCVMDRSKAKKGGLSPPTAVKSLVTIWNKDKVKDNGIRPSSSPTTSSPKTSASHSTQASKVVPDPESNESHRTDQQSYYSDENNEADSPQDDCVIQSSVRTAVEGFYLKYNPEKIDTIETILQHYIGFELELILHLIEKYEAIDESDLQIFAGYVSDQELLDIASHQIKVKKQALLALNVGAIASSTSANNANEVLSNHSSSPNNRSRNGSTASKANGVNSTAEINRSIDSTDQPTSQSSVSVGVQDGTRRPNGWNSSNNGSITNSPTSPSMTKTIPSSSSGSTNKTDEMLLMKKILNLESQITSFESEKQRMQIQIASLESEKQSLNGNLHTLTAQISHLQAENISLTNSTKNGSANAISSGSRSDGSLANLSLSMERESAMKKENMILNEQYKFAESNRQEMQSRLLEEIGMKENKQRQLMETIKLTQRLEAQVRFLAANAFESLKYETVIQVPLTPSSSSSSGSSVSGGDGVPSSTGIDIDQKTTGDDKTKGELLQELSLLKHQARALETSYKASRSELCIAVRQSAVADQRITEQQSIIHTLTVQLSGIKTELKSELQSMSGSTDTLRKQISDTTTELNRHKKLLAVAERKLEEYTSELADAKEETIALQDALAASRAAQDDLLLLCSEYSKGSESAALDYVRSFSERVLLEREDIIARLASLKDLDRELRSLGTIEAQKELQRLREELFKCRRSETQKERENVFLQKQLMEITARVSELDDGRGRSSGSR